MQWTEQQIDTLKVLWKDGLSCAQIASELRLFSRSAVIGKANRLGLDERKPGGRPWSKERHTERREKNATIKFKPKPRFHEAGEDNIRDTAAHDNAIPIGIRRTIADLNEESCRWPIGDPSGADFFFCGSQKFDGHSYCHYHCRVAYRPVG